MPRPNLSLSAAQLEKPAETTSSSPDAASPKPKVVMRLHSQVEESRSTEGSDDPFADDGSEVLFCSSENDNGKDNDNHVADNYVEEVGESDHEEVNSEDEDDEPRQQHAPGPPPDGSQATANTLLFSPGGQHNITSAQPHKKPPVSFASSTPADINLDESLFEQSLRRRVFKIGARVGKGASASVYRAIDSITLKILALKEISIAEPLKCNMLQEELKALAPQRKSLDDDDDYDSSSSMSAQQNSHNCIVDYYGAYYDLSKKTAFMVMEYMECGSVEGMVDLLYKAKQDDATLTDRYYRWSASVGQDLFTGLHNFHTTERVHRDIKPANILVNKAGEAKLSDFGLAKSVEASVDAKASSFVGTFNFMSPERLYGNAYSKTSDIWSAGMTLFYASRGKYPLDNQQGFWELVSELEDLVGKISKDEVMSEDERSFFSACFQHVDSRPSAELLLSHPFLSSTPPLTAEEKSAIRALVKKKQRDNLSLNLTTDEVSDVALVTLRARASSQTKPLMPTKAQKSSLAKSLDVFAITVEDSFDTAFLAHENELANYELRGAEAEKVKVVTRSERRRRRTFGAGARVEANIDRDLDDVAFEDIQGAMDQAASILDKHIYGDDFKVRAAHSKSAPPRPTPLDPPSQSLTADVNDLDVAQITAEMTKMNAAIKSTLNSEPEEVRRVSARSKRQGWGANTTFWRKASI